MTRQFHKYANIFPLLQQEELQSLANDIKTHGQLEPIQLFNDQILDGRNRYLACELVGVDPICESWTGTEEEALSFVWSTNANRRHLLPGQKAMCGVELLGFEKELAAKRMLKGKAEDVVEGGDTTLVKELTRVVDKNDNKSAARVAAKVGTNRQYVSDAAKISETHPDLAAQVKAGELTIPGAIKQIRKEEVKAKLESIEGKAAKALEGVYDVVVIDPPWDMEKIERDCAPNQVAFDYPTMSEEELSVLDIHAADDCHVWLWTTHKYLPMALRLLQSWGLKYVCTFVWHKNGGFQPFNLPQYNCEFALYARKGTPEFTTTKAFNTCFNADRGRHSEKPEEFYEMVRRVTAGRRLDMFNRRSIEGFDVWGNEA